MSKNFCPTCRFWEKQDGREEGLCRRNPGGIYTMPEDWCGEWKETDAAFYRRKAEEWRREMEFNQQREARTEAFIGRLRQELGEP